MCGEETLQACNLLVSSCVEGEAKIDNAGMRKTLADDQVTEVSIVGDEDPTLSDGDSEDSIV